MGPATRIIRNSIASLPSIASRFTVCPCSSLGAGNDFSHRAMGSIGQRYDSRNLSAGAAKKMDTYCGPSFMTMGNVFKKEFAFLWDTGCYVSLVDATLVKGYRRRTGFICQGDGGTVKTLGECPITWTMGGKSYHHAFTVMDLGISRLGKGESIQSPFVLGVDFMLKFKAVSFQFGKLKSVTVTGKQGESHRLTCL